MLKSLARVFGRNDRKLRKASNSLNRRLILEKLEDRWCPTTATWIGISTGGWFNPMNWEEQVLPQYGYDVVIKNDNYAPVIPDMYLDEEMNAYPYHPYFSSFTIDSSFGAGKFVYLDAGAGFTTNSLTIEANTGGGVIFGTTATIEVAEGLAFLGGSRCLLSSGENSADSGLFLSLGTVMTISGTSPLITTNIMVGHSAVLGETSGPSTLIIDGMYGNVRLEDGGTISVAPAAYLLLKQARSNSELSRGGITTNSLMGESYIEVKGQVIRKDIYADPTPLVTEDEGIFIGPKISVLPGGKFIVEKGHAVTLSYQSMGVVPLHMDAATLTVDSKALLRTTLGEGEEDNSTIVCIGVDGQVNLKGKIDPDLSVSNFCTLTISSDVASVGRSLWVGSYGKMKFSAFTDALQVGNVFSLYNASLQLKLKNLYGVVFGNVISCKEAEVDLSELSITVDGGQPPQYALFYFILTSDDENIQTGHGFNSILTDVAPATIGKDNTSDQWYLNW